MPATHQVTENPKAERGEFLSPQTIIDEARRWLGTPYRHQGRQRGTAVDCVGLVFGVAHNVGLGSEDFWRRQHQRWGRYKRIPDGHTLYDGFSRFLPEYAPAAAAPGDVLLISFAGAPRHTAILTAQGTIIHAYANIKRCTEQRWIDSWRRDTTSAFRLREVDPQALEEVPF